MQYSHHGAGTSVGAEKWDCASAHGQAAMTHIGIQGECASAACSCANLRENNVGQDAEQWQLSKRLSISHQPFIDITFGLDQPQPCIGPPSMPPLVHKIWEHTFAHSMTGVVSSVHWQQATQRPTMHV
jgi:hypothetical protein